MHRRIALLLTMLLIQPLAGVGLAPRASAAAQTSKTVYIQTVDIATGESITTACYVLIDASEEGCDENGDGMIRLGIDQQGHTTHFGRNTNATSPGRRQELAAKTVPLHRAIDGQSPGPKRWNVMASYPRWISSGARAYSIEAGLRL